jgi:hypothetical protein
MWAWTSKSAMSTISPSSTTIALSGLQAREWLLARLMSDLVVALGMRTWCCWEKVYTNFKICDVPKSANLATTLPRTLRTQKTNAEGLIASSSDILNDIIMVLSGENYAQSSKFLYVRSMSHNSITTASTMLQTQKTKLSSTAASAGNRTRG